MEPTMLEAGGRLTMPESEFYANIIRTALDGFWLADTAGRLLDVNDAYCKMTGYSREELLQMSVRDLEAAENAEETAAHIKKVIAQGADRFETRHRRKNGSTLEIEIGVTYSPAGFRPARCNSQATSNIV
ncbi:hypothetical protein A3J44_06780 [candidate division WOR-1 bacterium RIFCSPHIGHO2_02_FULL_45_12]|nr:MAG: hypothetical protein A3J44_06780 [candidate division WOR-1 bacterium RIFCSPHIGHO2_02_FULL_45_12]